MKNIEHENLLVEAINNGCNLFLGSGFSILAEDIEKRRLPLASELKSELLTAFRRPELGVLDLGKISTILKATAGETFRAYLTKRFVVESFSAEYNSTLRIRLANIFTTNIDDLVYKIFDRSEESYISDVYRSGPSLYGKSAVNYIPLHGSVRHDDRDYVFSTTEIATAFAADPDRWLFLRERLSSQPTIFVGYSAEDAGILQTLAPLLTSPSAKKNTNWIVVHPSGAATIPYFQALGLSISVGDTRSFLDFVKAKARRVATSKGGPGRASLEDFRDMQIPKLSQVVSRPISEFFAGMPPTWSDVYSGAIPHLSPFKKVQNILAGKKHALVIGAPASGKTTLCMQVAADHSFAGLKLFADASALPIERAHLLAHELNGEKCLLFIDNYTEALDAVGYFSSLPNFRLVCSDRAYNYEFTSHLIDLRRWEHVVATALTDSDVQDVIRTIPAEIKNGGSHAISMEGDLQPSLFEVVEENVIFPKLKERYVKALQAMEQTDRATHDFLLMCCYVHRCRVPVSFDMAYAFLRKEISDYSGVGKAIDRLGDLIADYRGQLVASDQDYYVPRSLLLSDAILWQSSAAALHRVIGKFHDEVSSDRIVRRDIFNRWAYDKDLIGKAYQWFEEGVAFYNQAMARDRSPYLKQQAALYCLKKGHFKDAFYYADRALSEGGSGKFSIKNTFAVVQFASNIDVHDDTGGKDQVRQYLDDSMALLGECYHADKRKIYHALEYGRQAIRYWQRYQDSKANEYLKNALTWVAEEMKLNTWNRNLRSLHRELLGFLKSTP